MKLIRPGKCSNKLHTTWLNTETVCIVHGHRGRCTANLKSKQNQHRTVVRAYVRVRALCKCTK